METEGQEIVQELEREEVVQEPEGQESAEDSGAPGREDTNPSPAKRMRKMDITDKITSKTVKEWTRSLKEKSDAMRDRLFANARHSIQFAAYIAVPEVAQTIFSIYARVEEEISRDKRRKSSLRLVSIENYCHLRAAANKCWILVAQVLNRAFLYDLFYTVLYPMGTIKRFFRNRNMLNEHFNVEYSRDKLPFLNLSCMIPERATEETYASVCPHDFEVCYVTLAIPEDRDNGVFIVPGDAKLPDTVQNMERAAYKRVNEGVLAIMPPSSSGRPLAWENNVPRNLVALNMEQGILMQGVVSKKTSWNKVF